MEKIEVNARTATALRAADRGARRRGHGRGHHVEFEKFLVSPTGEVVARFRPQVDPEDPVVIEAIEAALPV